MLNDRVGPIERSQTVSQSNSKSNTPKSYTAEFKARVVLEVLSGTKTFSQACRDYEISEQSLSNWKSLFLENAATIFTKAGDKKNQPDPNEQKIAELERMVGRLTVELEAAKKAYTSLSPTFPWRKNGA